MERVRDLRFDTLKGFLILCVLFRHFYKEVPPQSVVAESIVNFIHFYTMPLFVFMSGFFTRHVEDSKRYWKGILGILETYVVFQVIKGLAYHYSIIWLVTIPAPMMWYLLALIYWKILYFILYRIGFELRLFHVLVCILLSLIAGFVPFIGRSLAISRFFYFAPYFFLGLFLRDSHFLDKIYNHLSRYLAICVLVMTMIVSVIFALYHNANLAIVFGGGEPYPQSDQWLYLFFRLVSYVVSTIVSISIIRIASAPSALMGTVGKDSLKFYMFQGIGLMMFCALPITWSFLLATLYAFFTSAAIFFFNKTRLSNIVLRPISFIVNFFVNN